MKHELTIEPHIIAALKHIVSKDEARYVLTGINLRCLKGRATFTATDGRALASIQTTIPVPDDLNVILPTRVPNKENSIQIDMETKKVTYVEPGQESTLPLINKVYPNFLQVVPDEMVEPKGAAFGVHYLEKIIACAKAYAKKTRLNNDTGLYCMPQGTGASIFSLEVHPEWFAMLMPRSGKPTIPNWLKKK